MSDSNDYSDINRAKADMGSIYDQPDPRAYFTTLQPMGYDLPTHAKPVFQGLIAELARRRDRPVRVLDVGCSYGINGALLTHDLTMAELYTRWSAPEIADKPVDAVIADDRTFFAGLPRQDGHIITGVDRSQGAVAYAVEAGLIDAGFALDLETDPLPESVHAALSSVDLVISTGCVGYVTDKSFAHLMPAVAQELGAWVGNFVLRMFPYDAIADTIDGFGYQTERLAGRYFRQRRFASAEEQEKIVGELRDHGLEPNGLETEGHLIAEFHVSRPIAETDGPPLSALLTG